MRNMTRDQALILVALTAIVVVCLTVVVISIVSDDVNGTTAITALAGPGAVAGTALGRLSGANSAVKDGDK